MIYWIDQKDNMVMGLKMLQQEEKFSGNIASNKSLDMIYSKNGPEISFFWLFPSAFRLVIYSTLS